MKMAIAMQCHDNYDQINELINFFDDEGFDIYIHVDKKSNIYSKINKHKNVYMIRNRVNVQWGQFSQVEATLELFEEIKNSKNKYSYIHLISGQDIPLKSIRELKNIFKNNNKEYLEYSKLPNGWPTDGADRYKVYYPQWMISRPKNKIKRLIRVIYRNIVLSNTKLQRKFKFFDTLYGGSSWFSITGDCFEYLLDYLENNKEYIEFFRHSLCSDEIFFHTIILNSKFKENVVNENLRYIDWKNSLTGSPKNLEFLDLQKAVKSNNVFARKVVDLNLYKNIISIVN